MSPHTHFKAEKSKKKMKYLFVRLSEEQSKFLDDYSNSKGLNKSDVTRNLIARLEHLTSDELKEEILNYSQNRKSEQLNLTLTEEEIRTLEGNAKAHGFSRTQPQTSKALHT